MECTQVLGVILYGPSKKKASQMHGMHTGARCDMV